MSDWIYNLIVGAIVVFAIVVCIGTYAKWQDCDEIGGTLVRGLFGWECVL